MLGALERSLYTLDVGVVTLVGRWCMFPQLCVPTKCISGMELLVDASVTKRERSSFSGDVSASVVVRCERASTAWCSASALLTTSTSNSDQRSRHHVRRPVLLKRLSIHLSESLSVRIVNLFLSR